MFRYVWYFPYGGKAEITGGFSPTEAHGGFLTPMLNESWMLYPTWEVFYKACEDW